MDRLSHNHYLPAALSSLIFVFIFTFPTSVSAWQNLETRDVPGGVEIIGYDGPAPTDFDIRDKIRGDDVVGIGASAFQGEDIETLTLPDTIEYVESEAFRGNQITDLTIDDSTQYIDDYAFADNQLNNISLPESLIELGEGAFENNYIDFVSIRGDLSYVGDYAFRDNMIDTVYFEVGVEEIGEGAFYNNIIESLYFPSSLHTIGDYAFSINWIDDLSFLDEGVENIGEGAFENNNLETLTMPSSLNDLGMNALSDNDISEITFPSSETEITHTGEVNPLHGNEENLTVFGPFGSPLEPWADGEGYDFVGINPVSAFEWEEYSDGEARITGYDGDATIMNIPEEIEGHTVTVIGDSAFFGMDLEELHLPDTITRMEAYSFYGSYFTTLEIPESVNTINNAAFGASYLDEFIVYSDDLVYNGDVFSEWQEGELVLKSNSFSTTEEYARNNDLDFESQDYDNGFVWEETAEGDANIIHYSNSESEIVIPEEIEGRTVVSIDQEGTEGSGFQNAPVEIVEVPESVEYIGEEAFSNSDLEDITLLNENIEMPTTDQHPFTGVTSALKITAHSDTDAETVAINEDFEFISIGGTTEQTTHIEVSFLGGKLTFSIPSIASFGTASLDEETQSFFTTFDDPIVVNDNRGTREGWRIDVSGERLSNRNTDHQMPEGSLLIHQPSSVEGPDFSTYDLPDINNFVQHPIDNGEPVNIASAEEGIGMGEHLIHFTEQSLELAANINSVDNAEEESEYQTTLSWQLISGP